MIKAIFFDVDGTLLSFKTHQMSDLTRKSLDVLREKGVKLFIATGRSPRSFKHVLEKIDYKFDGYVHCNGQYVIVDGKVIHDRPLDKDELIKLTDYIEEKGIATTFSEMDYTYMNFLNERVHELRNMLGSTLPDPNLEDVKKRVMDNTTYQLSAYIIEDEEIDFYGVSDSFKGVRWHPLFVDVIPSDGGKDVGIQKVLDHFDIKVEEAMAFGDGGNDTDMLAYVGHGIAMGNAVQSAKDVSDYITESASDEGIYKALVKYGLVGEL